jgi:ABC-2 type transport system ATP-binding protein
VEIRIENVSKNIKGATVLDNISLKLMSGSIYGLRGKNGAGKTMLLRLLCGLILPTTGKVFINDAELGSDISFPESVGILIENPGFINSYSGFKNLKILASINSRIPDQTIIEMMRHFDLDPADKKKVRAYSLGMKQKLGITSALMENPELILLDEPINALDEASSEKVLRLLTNRKKEGALIVVASHDREELDFLSDTIFEMENGRIISSEHSGGGHEK